MAHSSKKPDSSEGKSTTLVEAHLEALDHSERPLVDALRALIASAVPDALEEIKWNAPSFAKATHFATLNLRAKRGIQLVLHLGAKPRTDIDMRTIVTNDGGLLEWKGPDRAVLALTDLAQLQAHAVVIQRVVAVWSQAVD